jgi:hypothetical protein
MRLVPICLTAGLMMATASPSQAQTPWDRNEHLLGATYLSAQSGNGRLTVGVGPLGEVAVLSWPSPSYFDQVDFETDASEDAREQPFFGALESEGIFGGLRVTFDDGTDAFTWLRDPAWTQAQRYASDTSAAVEHTSRSDALGLTVTQWTTVADDRDVVLRRTRVERDSASSVASVSYVLYANLAPTTNRNVIDPLQTDDGDFAAYWDLDAEAAVHFRPDEDRADFSALLTILNTSWAIEGAWRSGLDAMRDLQAEVFGDGAAIAIGGATSPSAHHIGTDTDSLCGETGDWAWTPESAFDAAQAPDGGRLVDSPVAGCRANFALSWDADLAPMGTPAGVDFDVFWAADATPAGALDALAAARIDGFDAGRARADAALDAMLAERFLPVHDDLGPEVVAFAQRALIALHQGTDASTAAMVASISTQPAYYLDWPRDSVFFDLGLDVAGAFDLVSRHKRFLADRQNKTGIFFDNGTFELLQSPPGAWRMNFFADGRPGTTVINHFEIDQVGLMLWGYWAHSTFAPNDDSARDALASVWPSIERGAHLLAACMDPSHPTLGGDSPAEVPEGHPPWWPAYTALLDGTIPDADARATAMAGGDWEALRPCEANEDDNPFNTVSLYSTHTTRMGLLGAVRAARALCIDDPRVDYWEERAHELGAVAFQLYFEPGAGDTPGRWVDDDGDAARADWILWPEELSVDPSLDEFFENLVGTHPDAKSLRTAVQEFTREALDDYALAASTSSRAAAALETDGAAYEQKQTLSLARYWAINPRSAGRLADSNVETIRTIAVDLPIPGTRHLGEVWVSLDTDDDGVFDVADQRVAQPHLWTQMLTYLSAMAVAAPERFAFEGAVSGPWCPEGEEPVIFRETPSCGCEDDTTEAEAQVSAAFLLLLGVPALARRRRR